MSEKLLLLDAHNLAMRSWFAAKDTMTVDGINTGALVLFCNSLSMNIRTERPDKVLVCWDSGDSAYRLRVFPEYKAARRAKKPAGPVAHRDTFALIEQFLLLAGITQWFVPGEEADDLIAAAWRAHDGPVVILSSDHDLMQLLDERTTQIRFSSAGADTDRWDRARFIQRYQHTPEQLPLMMALTGDPGDGVVGMAGIGPVKAHRMLTAAQWDLDKAMDAHPDSYDQVRISLALVDLLHGRRVPDPVPDPVFHPVGPMSDGWAVLSDFLAAYQLRQITDKIASGRFWAIGD